MTSKYFVIVLFVLTSYLRITGGLKILGIFPVPGRSHFVMPFKLLQELARLGHQVDVVSHFPLKKSIPNYRDLSLEGSMEIATNNMTFEQTKTFTSFSMRFFMAKIGTDVCNLLAHPVFSQLLKEPKEKYDIVIVELFGAHCYIGFGKHFNAPVVGIVVSKMHDWLYGPFGIPFNTAYVPSLFSSYNQKMSFLERLQNTILSFIVIPQINYYMEEQLYHVKKYFGRQLSSMREIYDDIGILLVNSHYSLNDVLPVPQGVIEIGGLHVDDPQQKLSLDIKNWLDESKEGCVYISFGSMLRIETLPKGIIQEFYKTFEQILPVRVLMKIVDSSLLPPGLPNNVLTSKWLPQVAVLKHENVKAFVTHGGLMGTQESVAHGVPMVGMPVFGDQYTNVNSYARRNIAIKLNYENLDTKSLTKAIKTVMFDSQYRKNIKFYQDLFTDRPIKPLNAAVYWIEFAAKHGNVLKSPAAKLHWWQYYLIDIYGFMIFCILTVLYFVKLFFSLIRKKICSRRTSSSKIVSRSRKEK